MEFKPGQRVQLTGKFLRSTGQIAGGEGQKVWTVKAVKTYEHGSTFVTVDEPANTEYFTAEELAAGSHARVPPNQCGEPEAFWEAVVSGLLAMENHTFELGMRRAAQLHARGMTLESISHEADASIHGNGMQCAIEAFQGWLDLAERIARLAGGYSRKEAQRLVENFLAKNGIK